MDGVKKLGVAGVVIGLACGASIGATPHVEPAREAGEATERFVADRGAISIGTVQVGGDEVVRLEDPPEAAESLPAEVDEAVGTSGGEEPGQDAVDDSTSGDVASLSEHAGSQPPVGELVPVVETADEAVVVAEDAEPMPAAAAAVTHETELASPVVLQETMSLGGGAEGSTGDGGLGGLALEGLGLVRTVGAVAGVVVLILLIRMVLGRAARMGGGGLRMQLGAGGRAPSGLVQILGRYPVARGQSLVLMKLDRRVLLLSQTSAGFTTLSEITEADDVASILSKSRDEEGESLSARFGALLRRLERDPEMGNGDDVEIASYLRRPSLDEIEGEGGIDGELSTDEAGAALRRRLEGLRGLSV